MESFRQVLLLIIFLGNISLISLQETSSSVASYTTTLYYEGISGTLYSSVATMYGERPQDGPAYTTYLTTDYEGNVLTNTISTLVETYMSEDLTTVVNVTITGLKTVTTSYNPYGYPITSTITNQVSINGTRTLTLSSPLPTTATTGNGTIPLPQETISVTDSLFYEVTEIDPTFFDDIQPSALNTGTVDGNSNSDSNAEITPTATQQNTETTQTDAGSFDNEESSTDSGNGDGSSQSTEISSTEESSQTDVESSNNGGSNTDSGSGDGSSQNTETSTSQSTETSQTEVGSSDNGGSNTDSGNGDGSSQSTEISSTEESSQTDVESSNNGGSNTDSGSGDGSSQNTETSTSQSTETSQTEVESSDNGGSNTDSGNGDGSSQSDNTSTEISSTGTQPNIETSQTDFGSSDNGESSTGSGSGDGSSQSDNTDSENGNGSSQSDSSIGQISPSETQQNTETFQTDFGSSDNGGSSSDSENYGNNELQSSQTEFPGTQMPGTSFNTETPELSTYSSFEGFSDDKSTFTQTRTISTNRVKITLTETVYSSNSFNLTIDNFRNTYYTVNELNSNLEMKTETYILRPKIVASTVIEGTETITVTAKPFAEPSEITLQNDPYYKFVRNYSIQVDKNTSCSFLADKTYNQFFLTNLESMGFGLISFQDSLIFTDKYAKKIIKKKLNSGQESIARIDGDVLYGLLPTNKSDEYILALDNKIVLVKISFTNDATVVKYIRNLYIFQSAEKLSTIKVDKQGRLWIAAKYQQSNGQKTLLFCLSKGAAHIKANNLLNVGGMAFLNKKVYISDLDLKMIFVYNLNEKSGNLSNRNIFYSFRSDINMLGSPYDLTLDVKDNLYVAVFGKKMIAQINTKTKQLKELPLPDNKPISLTFAGEKNKTLFVMEKFKVPYLYGLENLDIPGLNPRLIVADSTIPSRTVFINNPKSLSFPRFAFDFYPSEPCSDNIKLSRDASCAFAGDKPIVQVLNLATETKGLSIYYNQKEKAIYFTDAFKPSFIKYKIDTGTVREVEVTGITSTSSITPIKDKDDQYLVSEDRHLATFKNKFNRKHRISVPFRRIIATLPSLESDLVFGIGRTDSKGRLWIGTRYITNSTKSSAKLYMLRKRALTVAEGDFTSVGGITWDESHAYVVDSGERKIYKFKYNPVTGTLSLRMTFFVLRKTNDLWRDKHITLTDVAADNQGGLWVAVSGRSTILRLNTTTASIIGTVQIPISSPSSMRFIGSDLWVTSQASSDCHLVNARGRTIILSNLGVQGATKSTKFKL